LLLLSGNKGQGLLGGKGLGDDKLKDYVMLTSLTGGGGSSSSKALLPLLLLSKNAGYSSFFSGGKRRPPEGGAGGGNFTQQWPESGYVEKDAVYSAEEEIVRQAMIDGNPTNYQTNDKPLHATLTQNPNKIDQQMNLGSKKTPDSIQAGDNKGTAQTQNRGIPPATSFEEIDAVLRRNKQKLGSRIDAHKKGLIQEVLAAEGKGVVPPSKPSFGRSAVNWLASFITGDTSDVPVTDKVRMVNATAAAAEGRVASGLGKKMAAALPTPGQVLSYSPAQLGGVINWVLSFLQSGTIDPSETIVVREALKPTVAKVFTNVGAEKINAMAPSDLKTVLQEVGMDLDVAPNIDIEEEKELPPTVSLPTPVELEFMNKKYNGPAEGRGLTKADLANLPYAGPIKKKSAKSTLSNVTGQEFLLGA
jgi:hypothetical protein